MRDADVISVFKNTIYPVNLRTSDVKLVDVGSSGRCRLFSVTWIQSVIFGGYSEESGITLYSGDPSAGGDIVYQHHSSTIGSGAGAGFSGTTYPELPSHGILFDDDMWVVGHGIGISGVGICYQLGG